MEASKFEEVERLANHRRNLLKWQKEMEVVDKLNKIDELENDLDTYITENHNKLTTGDAYALWDFFNWIKIR